jgi:nucleotide-binding universal stress UspA family protein
MAGVGPVVVGTDFSDTAGVALAEARRLAGLLTTDVIVVHVADGQSAASVLEGADAPTASRWLFSAGLTADRLVVRQGSAWVELARFASEVSPLLVVVGSHGRSGYQPLNIGSTASRVSVHARCPVVVISPRVTSFLAEGVAGEIRSHDASRAGAVAAARVAPGNS